MLKIQEWLSSLHTQVVHLPRQKLKRFCRMTIDHHEPEVEVLIIAAVAGTASLQEQGLLRSVSCVLYAHWLGRCINLHLSRARGSEHFAIQSFQQYASSFLPGLCKLPYLIMFYFKCLKWPNILKKKNPITSMPCSACMMN